MAAYLPPEIISMIIDSYEHDYQSLELLDTFKALCLTSKQCREVAQPWIFRSWDHTLHRREFLRALLERPILAKEVRRIRVDDWKTEPDPNYVLSEPFQRMEEELKCLFFAAVDNLVDLPRSFRSDLKDLVFTSPKVAVITLTIILSTHLVELRLLDSSEVAMTLLAEYARLKGPAFLSHLKLLKIAHGSDEGDSVSMQSFAPLFNAPKLDTFEGTSLGPPYTPVDGLTSIHIRNAAIDGPALQALLVTFPALQSCDILWSNAIYEYGDHPDLAWDRIGDSLRAHGAGLKRLHLEFACFDDPVDATRPMGDLRALVHLEELDVPAAAILGAKVDSDYTGVTPDIFVSTLPKSLQKLRMAYGDDFTDNLAYAFARLMQGRHLKDITIGFHPFERSAVAIVDSAICDEVGMSWYTESDLDKKHIEDWEIKWIMVKDGTH